MGVQLKSSVYHFRDRQVKLYSTRNLYSVLYSIRHPVKVKGLSGSCLIHRELTASVGYLLSAQITYNLYFLHSHGRGNGNIRKRQSIVDVRNSSAKCSQTMSCRNKSISLFSAVLSQKPLRSSRCNSASTAPTTPRCSEEPFQSSFTAVGA